MIKYATLTIFRNGTRQTILTADITITTESGDFEAVAQKIFTMAVKVDVTLNLSDTLEASESKEVKISVAPLEPESISEVLQSLSVKISGNETLTTNTVTQPR